MVRWRGRRESTNVEDRRGQSGGIFGGGGFRFPMGRSRRRQGRGLRIPMPGGGSSARGGGGFSFWTILIVLGVCWMLGINPLKLLSGGGGAGIPFPQIETGGRPSSFDVGQDSTSGIPRIPGPSDASGRSVTDIFGRSGERRPVNRPSGNDDLASFVKVMLASTEDVWRAKFQAVGRDYRDPKLVLFSGTTTTRCGRGQAAMGPFYCPLDQTIYIDLSFYRELRDKFGAPGDFAQAYVVAHEVGHHVQTLLGITEQVQGRKFRVGRREANRLQVRMELQADCLAGVWAAVANRQQQILEPGDVEEGMRAASAIGDDMMQRRAGRRVVPDAFTHGSAAQRQRWLQRGLQTGDMQQCDTFRARQL